MRWIAWGFRVIDGERQLCQLGILNCKGHALVALVNARRRYEHRAVDHVQSVLSHEIEVLETQHKLVCDSHHPRRKKQPLDDAAVLHNIMSSGNTYHEELVS